MTIMQRLNAFLQNASRPKGHDAGYQEDPGREKIHFLHIGKNAGTQVKHLARIINDRCDRVFLKVHPHNVRLRDLGEAESYFFSIRKPDRRFFSGFYSRKRKGYPRHFSDWSANEERAFADFEHANDLAEALSDSGASGDRAVMAMKSSLHLSMMQIDWFDCSGYFLEVNPPVHIIRQECFDQDFERFCAKLGLEQIPAAAEDKVVAHKNDYDGVPPLSDKAKANLRQWYYQDYRFYDMCANWIERGA